MKLKTPIKKRSVTKKCRKLIAIGDLHGDYYKLLRHLKENNLINKRLLNWNRKANNIDLVLLGDYVDWRGEKLEGDRKEWIKGSKRILLLLKSLYEQIEILNKNKNFNSNIYLLFGNHDDMMLNGLDIFNVFFAWELEEILEGFIGIRDAGKLYAYKKLNESETETVNNFLNWFVQGGRETIVSFGSFDEWKDEMEGDLGNFLREKLKLACIVDKTLLCHSISDLQKYWRSDIIINKRFIDFEKNDPIKREFLWGRKLWEMDYKTGGCAEPFKKVEIEKLIKNFNIDEVVVGHTPLKNDSIKRYYEGKVINLDFHGSVLSPAYIRKYKSGISR